MKSVRVLIAEDDEIFRNGLVRSLNRAGYEVAAVAVDGAEALGIFEQNRDGFDLVITDFDMPKMNGVQLAHGIRTFCPDVPVIIRTSTPEHVASSSEYVVMSKMSGTRELLEAIERAVGESR